MALKYIDNTDILWISGEGGFIRQANIPAYLNIGTHFADIASRDCFSSLMSS
jgi:hypothetical protein